MSATNTVTRTTRARDVRAMRRAGFLLRVKRGTALAAAVTGVAGGWTGGMRVASADSVWGGDTNNFSTDAWNGTGSTGAPSLNGGATTALDFLGSSAAGTGTTAYVATNDEGAFVLNKLVFNAPAGASETVTSATGGSLNFSGTAPVITQNGAAPSPSAARSPSAPRRPSAGLGRPASRPA